jgi:hypothetical protein
MYFLKDSSIKKELCLHLLRLKYPQGKDKPFAKCLHCDYSVEVKN